MKCVVTGAAGFIGQAIVRRLISEGHQVMGLVHSAPSGDLDTRVRYVVGDITDRLFLQNNLKDAEVVFHCAALVRDYAPKKKVFRS